MTLPRRPRLRINHDIEPAEWAYLTGDMAAVYEADPAAWWSFEYDRGKLFREGRPSVTEMVRLWGSPALQAFVERNPGRRPNWWWSQPGAPRRKPGETEARCLKRTGNLTPDEVRAIHGAADA